MLSSFRTALWHERLESVALLLCAPIQLPDSLGWRLIVREAHVAPDSAYEERTEVSAKISPAFGLPFEKRARTNGWSLVYCHSHPHQDGSAEFSNVDDDAEVQLAQYAENRSPGVPHLALLLSKVSVAARRLGGAERVRVLEIGERVEVYSDPRETTHSPTQRFERQLLAFGIEGQRRIQSTRVGIVGLGGTGTHVAQQLAYLGVSDFLLIDRDCLESTNLNRTIGAAPTDVGRPKCQIAERMIRTINPQAQISTCIADVVDAEIAPQLAGVDFIFCCTDSHASRHLINQLVYQYLVACIDLGVAIDTRKAMKFAGHVKALAPGLACLWCVGHLDPRQVREELMSPELRSADPYFGGGVAISQPAVISLNGTIASLAITMFLSMVAGIPAPARYLIYDGSRSRVSGVSTTPDPECNFCSEHSTALGGAAFPLPVRYNDAS